MIATKLVGWFSLMLYVIEGNSINEDSCVLNIFIGSKHRDNLYVDFMFQFWHVLYLCAYMHVYTCMPGSHGNFW